MQLQWFKPAVYRHTPASLRYRFSQEPVGGFTLIELLVVIVIVGILGAMAYPVFFSFSRRAHYAEAKQHMGTIAREIQVVYLEESKYPDDVHPNIRPQGLNFWPQEMPYNSTLDYDHWAVGGGKCYVQLAFWGEENQREYDFHQAHGDPGQFTEIDDNLILAVSEYDCGITTTGPID